MPFKPEDFETESWRPHSGWPLTNDDVMQPYIRRAIELLGLPEAGWDLDHWERMTGEERLPFDPSKITNEVFLIEEVRLGELMRPELESASDVHVYLHANAVEIESDDTARRVTGCGLERTKARSSGSRRK